MPLLEVSLPLDHLLSSSCWGWLIALCLATVATFSRLSPFSSSFMYNLPISSFISCRHAKRHPQLTSEENPSPDEELTASKAIEAFSQEQAGSEKKSPWSSLYLQQCGAGEEDEVEEDVVPTCLEAEASKNHPEASTAALEAPRACTTFLQATSWSRRLQSQISARMGIPWHCDDLAHKTRTRGVLSTEMPLHYQARLPCVAEILCTPKSWSCQELQVLQLLQVPNLLSTISAVDMGIHSRFAHFGYYNGEIALWDVETRASLNRLCTRESPVAALFVAPSYPRIAIAACQSVHNQNCSIISVWDDRCALHSANLVSSMPASRMKAFECRAQEVGIAGRQYVSSHDLRMLKENPILLYAAGSLGKSAWEGQGKLEGTN